MVCIAPCVTSLAQSTLTPMEDTTLSSYLPPARVGVISVPVKARFNKKVKLLLYKSAFLKDFPSALDIS